MSSFPSADTLILGAAASGSQYSCFRVGGHRPTHLSPYMSYIGCHQSYHGTAKVCIGNQWYCSLSRSYSHYFKSQNTTLFFVPKLQLLTWGSSDWDVWISGQWNPVHRGLRAGERPRQVWAWRWKESERHRGRKRPSSVKDHKNRTAGQTEIDPPPPPRRCLYQPFWLTERIRQTSPFLACSAPTQLGALFYPLSHGRKV